MMKRYVPRSPRRAVQDFHFFAASAAGTDGSGREPQIPRSGNLPATPKTPPAPSPRPIPTPQPEPEPEPVGAAALERAMDYLPPPTARTLPPGAKRLPCEPVRPRSGLARNLSLARRIPPLGSPCLAGAGPRRIVAPRRSKRVEP